MRVVTKPGIWTAILLALSVLACNYQAPDHQTPADLPKELVDKVDQIARQQAMGLKEAEIVIHRVFELGEKIDSAEEVQQVAVDVEFKGFSSGFDLDDIEIVDADAGDNLSYCGDFRPLKDDGSFQQNRAVWESQEESFRVLLVFYISPAVRNIKLEYWGDLLTEKPWSIGEGTLKYDEGKVIAGLEYWKWDESYHTSGLWQRGSWLVVRLSAGATVVDMNDFPPTMHAWALETPRGIEADPNGGWWILANRRIDDEMKSVVLFQSTEVPGDEQARFAVSDDYLQGLAMLGKQCLAFADQSVFKIELPEGKDTQLRLEREVTVPTAKGFVNIIDSREYAHAQLTTGNGDRLLLWDGDGYTFDNNRLKKSWPMGIQEGSYGFCTQPDHDNGFYYVTNEEVGIIHVVPGKARQRVMTGVANVMSIQRGPQGSLLYSLGNNDAGYLCGLWFSEDDTYIPVRPAEIDPKIEPHYFDSLHWSEKTQRFYLVAWGGVYTFPGEGLLRRKRMKLPKAAFDEEN